MFNNDTKEFGMCYFWKDIIMEIACINVYQLPGLVIQLCPVRLLFIANVLSMTTH